MNEYVFFFVKKNFKLLYYWKEKKKTKLMTEEHNYVMKMKMSTLRGNSSHVRTKSYVVFGYFFGYYISLIRFYY